jgi:bacillithiol biosynthesis cysteine-adding enzyme BshC
VTQLRVVTTLLGGTPLAAAALDHSAPAQWYGAAPLSPADWTRRCKSVASQGSDWLAAVRPALGSGAAMLDRVADGKGVVVTTGQQAALFGGPLYTWLKAIAALELAARIERETGVPAVPVFWAATDDADFTEAATTVVNGPDGAQRLTLTQRPPDGIPMSHATLGKEVAGLFEALRVAAGSLSDERALRAAEAFVSGATMGEAYVSMLRTLLEPLGVAVIDAAHPAVGAASDEFLRLALRRGRDIHAALQARRNEIAEAGFDEPVDTARELSLVFAWEAGADALPRKRRLTLDEAGTDQGGATRLSPNVLLRPVVERMLLPTVAYVAGPGEVAYFAQVSAVAESLGAAQPLAVPRWSGMIVPADVDATVRRLGLSMSDLRDPHAAEARIARAALPKGAIDAVAALRTAIGDTMSQLDGALPAAARDGARNQLERRVDRIERRLVAAAKHRESATLRAVATARGMLYPFGKPQERALNVVPLMARYGEELIAAVREACARHAESLVVPPAATA